MITVSNSDIVEYIKNNNLQQFKQIIDIIDVNMIIDDPYLPTLLHHAAFHGREDIVNLLMSKNANQNIINNQELTAIDIAFAQGNHDIVHLLQNAFLLYRYPTAAPQTTQNSYLELRDKDISMINIDIMLNSFPQQNIHNTAENHINDISTFYTEQYAIQPTLNNTEECYYEGYNPDDTSSLADIIRMLNEPMVPIDTNQIIYNAIINDDIDTVKNIINTIDPNEQDVNGNTALHVAAQYGRLNIAKLLINKGANINAINKLKENPFHICAKNGQLKLFKCLDAQNNQNGKFDSVNAENILGHNILYTALKHKHNEFATYIIDDSANINEKNKAGRTVLHIAIRENEENIVKYLIENEADINISERQARNTPLHIAAQYGHLEIAKLLVDNGAVINKKNIYHQTALDLAENNQSKGNNIELIDFLKQSYNDNGLSTNKTEFFRAIINNDFVKVQEILSSDKELVNAFDGNNTNKNTPLHIAAQYGHFEIAKLLIANGAVIDKKNRYNQTALDLAENNQSKGNNTELIKLLKQLYNDNGLSTNKTEFFRAIINNDFVKVEEILSSDKELVNASDGSNTNRNTPLHIAAQYGHLEIAKLLIANGAVIDKKNRYNQTALDFAMNNNKQNSHTEIVNYLKDIFKEKLISTDKQELFKFVQNNQIDEVIEILDNNTDGKLINTRYINRQTVLHIAAEKVQVELAKELIARGAILNANDTHGQTAVYRAARSGKLEMVKLLVENGADINICSNDRGKYSPLEIAERKKHFEIVNYLQTKSLSNNTEEHDEEIDKDNTPNNAKENELESFGEREKKRRRISKKNTIGHL